jgi:hypothetical protein
MSYATRDKKIAAGVSDILANFGIKSFMAHEDIRVSEEWRQKILDELKVIDIFIPVLSVAFKGSDWAPQEIGLACSRPEVLIVPLYIDETIPFGFISHLQGKSISEGNIPLAFVIQPILEKFKKKMIPSVIEHLRVAGSFRYAESVMELIVPHFRKLTQQQVGTLIDISIKNNQIWSANKCSNEFLPELIKIHRKKIAPDKRTILEYQLENGEPYRSPASPSGGGQGAAAA